MTTNSDFSEQYKDPRWQKKRLEIMQRDRFSCNICGEDEKTLNVHHKYYLKNTMPWEYNDQSLVTLCESCHAQEHEQKEHSETMLMEMKEIFDFYDLCQIFDALLNDFKEFEKDEYFLVKKDYLITGLKSKIAMKIGESIVNERIRFAKNRRQ